MTARGVIDTSPITCFCTCPARHSRKNREQYSTPGYFIMECLARPYNDKTTLNYKYECMLIKHFVPVNHTTMQCTTKQQTRTLPGIIYNVVRGMLCDASLFDLIWRYAPSALMSHKSITPKNGGKKRSLSYVYDIKYKKQKLYEIRNIRGITEQEPRHKMRLWNIQDTRYKILKTNLIWDSGSKV